MRVVENNLILFLGSETTPKFVVVQPWCGSRSRHKCQPLRRTLCADLALCVPAVCCPRDLFLVSQWRQGLRPFDGQPGCFCAGRLSIGEVTGWLTARRCHGYSGWRGQRTCSWKCWNCNDIQRTGPRCPAPSVREHPTSLRKTL